MPREVPQGALTYAPDARIPSAVARPPALTCAAQARPRTGCLSDAQALRTTERPPDGHAPRADDGDRRALCGTPLRGPRPCRRCVMKQMGGWGGVEKKEAARVAGAAQV